MNKKGGYIIIDLQSATIVNDLAKALDSNKPVLVYDADDVANFYTLSYDSDNELFILTGAKDSYSVASDGTITPIVPSSNKIYKHNINIEDSDNNQALFVIYSSKSTSLTFNELLILADGEISVGMISNNIVYGFINKVTDTLVLTYGTNADENSFDSTSTITDNIIEI